MTVSRVVNQSVSVDESTRRRVQDAINKLNYTPNLLARGLRRQSTPDVLPPTYAVYETYRAYAQAEAVYPGSPGKGKRLGMASIFRAQPFCAEVEQNVIKQAKLAGIEAKDIVLLDNKYDAEAGLRNAEIMLALKPDVFIQHQADVKVNSIVAAKFKAAGIPLIAVDVPVPGAPFMGIDNWYVATVGGKAMASLMKKKWGGWGMVDMVVLLQNPAGGDVTMLRTEGFATTLSDEFGSEVEGKIVRVDGGMGTSGQAYQAMVQVLNAHPAAKRIAVTSVNEETMQGVITAIQEAGRWQRDDLIIITLGVDDLGKTQLRDGLSDAGVAFFPEKYGEYLIPAICALLEGAPVPSHLFVENQVITRENIDHFYPLAYTPYQGGTHEHDFGATD